LGHPSIPQLYRLIFNVVCLLLIISALRDELVTKITKPRGSRSRTQQTSNTHLPERISVRPRPMSFRPAKKPFQFPTFNAENNTTSASNTSMGNISNTVRSVPQEQPQQPQVVEPQITQSAAHALKAGDFTRRKRMESLIKSGRRPSVTPSASSASLTSTPAPAPAPVQAESSVARASFAAGPYAQVAEALISRLMGLVGQSGDWEMVAQENGGSVQVFRHKANEQSYKLVVEVSNGVKETFDVFSGVKTQTKWDEMAQDIKIVEQVTPSTRIQYLRQKGAFPATGRDLVLVHHMRCLPDGRWVSVAQSVDRDDCGPESGYVRAEANIIGAVVAPIDGDKRAQLTQVWDVDLRGFSPEDIMAFMVKKAAPQSGKNLIQLLSQ
ncbi:hypothetical protein HK102_008054, partial [Quaeritorhiza haematococci]